MKITEELVNHLAKQARLELDGAGCVLMAEELDKLVGYMEILNTVDTTGIEPLTHICQTTNVMRPDVVTQTVDRATLLKNAPEHTDEAFVVPKVIG